MLNHHQSLLALPFNEDLLRQDTIHGAWACRWRMSSAIPGQI